MPPETDQSPPSTYAANGLISYVVLRALPTNHVLPIAVADTAAGARAALREEREKHTRWTTIGITDVSDALEFTVRKTDGSLVAGYYVVRVAKWEREE